MRTDALINVVRGADAITTVMGRVVSWMALGTVLVCFATVYTRYALNTNFTWLQDLYVWKHAAVIVLGAGYTIMMGGFVRVDIFYAKWSPQKRAWADLIQTILFLLPFTAVCAWTFWNLFFNSYRADEASMNPGGLPNLWILKSSLLLFAAAVLLQGIAIMARSVLVLSGRVEWAPKATGH